MEMSDYLLISAALVLILSSAFFSVMLAVPDVSLKASAKISSENSMIVILLPENIVGRRENIENWTWGIFRSGERLARGEGESVLVAGTPVEIRCGINLEDGDLLKIWYLGLLLWENEITK